MEIAERGSSMTLVAAATITITTATMTTTTTVATAISVATMGRTSLRWESSSKSLSFTSL